MPELPEVETIRLQLQKYLVGHQIERIETKYRNFEGDPKLVVGGEISDIKRFGKVLSLDLLNGYSVIIHVKLTGQLIYRDSGVGQKLSPKVVGGAPGPHTHVIFYLDKGAVLYYNDIRRFGWIKVVDSSQVAVGGFIGKLGPEPFKDFTLEYFQKMLSKTSRAIKVVLMDQSKIAGVGNIYANDALWLSAINPKSPANQIPNAKVKALYESIHTVLKAGLKYGGASELSFVTPDGTEGEYQNHTLVYGHEGEICRECKKTKIRKYFLSGRGTYVCDTCQL